eukprot:100134_1
MCAVKLQLDHKMSMNIVEFDLNVFKYDESLNKCDGDNSLESMNQCVSLNRLLCALKYYTLLDIIKNIQHRDIFSHFITDIYDSFLNDYIHLINHHTNHLYELNKSLTENKFTLCNIKKCQFTARHHTQIKNALPPALNFFKQTMDSLHFYLFHLFECGLREKKLDLNNDDINSEERKDDDYFDAEFSRLHKSMNERKHITASFSRFKTNHKFTIKTSVDDINDNKEYETGDDEATFMDEMYKYLRQVAVNQDSIAELKAFIDSEEFDSESIQYDASNDRGNIENCINDKKCIESMKKFAKSTQMRSESFSIGIRFYYWPYYKVIKKLPNEQAFNLNNHSGYNVCDLMIKQRYSSFKEEISNYKHFDMSIYPDLVIKVNSYKDTDIVKQTKAHPKDSKSYMELHYDIPKDTILSYSNLLSLILYCDYTELSTDFSASFRKRKAFELLISVKNRNSHYFWLSKILRETVELYGGSSHGDGYHGGEENTLNGPFYCGMSWEMTLSEFNIRLNSPTSTSSQINVAIKFAGNKGIIMMLDTPQGDSNYMFLRCFNCNWISRYKEEDERLFFGGLWRIKVETVILRRTKQNFSLFIQSLYYFDCIVSGADTIPQLNAKHKRIIKSLINSKIEMKSSLKLDDYVNKTFECFTQNKQQIILTFHRINEQADKEITDLIMYKLKKNEEDESIKDINEINETNLFRKEIFILLPNVTRVVISSTRWNGYATYSFSLLKLLDLIESTGLKQVVVKAVRLRDEDTWITLLWSSLESYAKIKKAYNAKIWDISVKTVSASGRRKEDQLIIEKSDSSMQKHSKVDSKRLEINQKQDKMTKQRRNKMTKQKFRMKSKLARKHSM